MSRKRTIEKVVDVVSSSAPNATDGSLTRYAEQKLAGHFHHVIGIDELRQPVGFVMVFNSPIFVIQSRQMRLKERSLTKKS